MTVSPKVSASLWAFFRNVAAAITAIAACIALLWQVFAFLLAPRAEPYLATLNMVPTILDRLKTIEGRLPLPTVIIFEGSAFASPVWVHAGDRIKVTYLVTRTSDCEVTTFQRWHDIDRDAIDPAFNLRRPAIGSPVVAHPQPRSVVIEVPPDMPPGNWAYAPVFEMSEKCPNLEQVSAPLARIVVVPADEPIPLSPINGNQ